MITLAVILLAATATIQDQQPPQEPKPVPKGSVRVTTTGCLKGKALAAYGPREEGLSSGPDVRGKTFRLSGPKDVMKDVKVNDGHLVEVVGLVRQMDLQPYGLSGKLGGMRVGVGGRSGSSPMGNSNAAPSPAENVIVMDITSLRPLADTCSVAGR